MRIKKGFPLLLAMVLAFSPVMVSAEELSGDGDTTQYYKHTFTFNPDANEITCFNYPEKWDSRMSIKVNIGISSNPVTVSDPNTCTLNNNELITTGNPDLYYIWGPKDKGVYDIYNARDEDNCQKDGLQAGERYLTAPDCKKDGYEDFVFMIGVPKGTWCRNSGSFTPVKAVNEWKDVENPSCQYVGDYDFYLSKEIKVKYPKLNVTVSPPKATLYLNGNNTTKLETDVTPENVYIYNANWSLTDDSKGIVEVDEDGNVTAKKPGTAKIYAEVNGYKSEECVITVKETAVEKITFDRTSAKLNPGQTVDLKANFTPGNATDKSLTWSSSNTSVATVDENGKVTAVGIGRSTVTATSVSTPSVSATAVITVEENEEEKEKEKEKEKDVPVTRITLDKTSVKLNPGQTVNLNATVAPDNATDKSVKWSSSNTSVATVENGKVTAVGPGEAIITAASASSPSVTATAAITVEEKEEEEEEEEKEEEEEEEEKSIPVTSVTLNPKTKTLRPGQKFELDATVEPEDADYDLIWSSSNNKVVSVDEDGEVKAIAPGTAKITAEAGGKTASATIKVAGMELDTQKLVMKEGTSKTVNGTLVNDKIKSAKVTKDKDKVIDKVTVDKSGKKLTIKAKQDKKGEATVKVTSSAGNTQTIKVTVQKDPVTTKSVKILNSSGKAKTNFTVEKGKSLTLTIKATPDQVSTGEKAKVYKNSKSKYASAVIRDGKLVIKGKKKGQTKITVKVGNAKKTIKVSVKNK